MKKLYSKSCKNLESLKCLSPYVLFNQAEMLLRNQINEIWFRTFKMILLFFVISRDHKYISKFLI